jgi:hypothetical protein
LLAATSTTPKLASVAVATQCGRNTARRVHPQFADPIDVGGANPARASVVGKAKGSRRRVFTGCDVLDQAGVDRISGLAALLPQPLTGDVTPVVGNSAAGLLPADGPDLGRRQHPSGRCR